MYGYTSLVLFSIGWAGPTGQNQINIIVLVLIPSRSRIVTYIPPLPDIKAETYEFQSSAVNSNSTLLFPHFPMELNSQTGDIDYLGISLGP